MDKVNWGYFHVVTEEKKVLSLAYPRKATTEEPEYPAEWFETHKSKPLLQLTEYTTSMEDLTLLVDCELKAGSLHVDVATYFMYKVGLDIKEKVTEDWSSHNIVIAKKDEEICPWDLLKVELQKSGAPPGSTDGVKPRKKEALLGILTMIHRVMVAKDRGTEAYLSQVIERCSALLKQPPYSCSDSNLESAGMSFNHWKANRAYLTMIAALDMFFTEFPLSTHSKLRMGTIPSRYKDCAIINSINQLEVVSNMPVDRLFGWCFLEVLIRDVIRVSKAGQELGVKRSYTPYLSDMGLSKRSPYSATLNASLHVWCHTVGTMLGSRSSPRARIPQEVGLVDIIKVSELLAFAKRARAPLVLRVFESKKEADDAVVEEAETLPRLDEEEDDDDMVRPDGGEGTSTALVPASPTAPTEIPKKLNHVMWFQVLANREFVTPSIITKSIKKVIENLQTPRPGTVGEALLEHYKGQ